MIYGGVQAIWTTCNCFYGDYDLFEGLDGFFWAYMIYGSIPAILATSNNVEH